MFFHSVAMHSARRCLSPAPRCQHPAVPGDVGAPGALLPRAGAGACSSPHDSRQGLAQAPREAESVPRGQDGPFPSPVPRKKS